MKLSLFVSSLLFLISPFLYAQAPSSPDSKKVYVLDVSAYHDELLTAVAIQGLANRNAAQVFLFTGDANWVATFKGKAIAHNPGILAKYRNTDDAWMDYYTKSHGYSFQSLKSLNDLAALFAPSSAGLVLYNPSAKNLQWIAAMAFASTSNLIPVTARVKAGNPALATLPVKIDLTSHQESTEALQRWAWEQCQGKANKQSIYSIGGAGDPFGLDIAVAQKMFIYKLSTDEKKNPEEFKLLKEILGSLDPQTPVWGWGIPNEDELRNMASRMGRFQICSEVPNVSFHAKVEPLSSTPFKPAVTPPDPSQIPLENKYYIAFMVNEGDTVKAAATMESNGMWLQSQRGQIPISWGICPWICENFPAMMEYYFRNASDKDAFFNATSGWGYFTPGLTPYLREFANREKSFSEKAGIHVGASMGANSLKSVSRIDEWLDWRGLAGYIREDGKATSVHFTPEGRPVISAEATLVYPEHKYGVGKNRPPKEILLKKITEFIKNIPNNHHAPAFLPYYAGDPEFFSQVAQALPKNQFSFVTVDQMIDLAKRAGRLLIIGDDIRSVPPGTDEIPVELAVENTTNTPVSGKVTVQLPDGWTASPSDWSYSQLAPVSGQAHQIITLRAPAAATMTGTSDIMFHDNASGMNRPLTITFQNKTEEKGTGHN